MLKVEDVFRKLSNGPLRNVSAGNDGNGTIRLAEQPAIIGYINDALMDLYSRFNMSERQVTINQYSHITQYHLDKRYAYYNTERPTGFLPYILDLPEEPFSDDAIKILSVWNNLGHSLPLNDESHMWSMFTPMPTTLQTPYPMQDQALSVVYQASHPKLEYGVTTAEIVLPVVLHKSLVSMVASYFFRDMGSEGSGAKSQEHLANYENDCMKIEKEGQANITTIRNHTKFDQRGFV